MSDLSIVQYFFFNVLNFCVNIIFCRLHGDKPKTALDIPYKIFCEEGRYPGEIRRVTVDKVLVSMLRLVQIPTLSQFFLAHMDNLRNIMEAKPKVGNY